MIRNDRRKIKSANRHRPSVTGKGAGKGQEAERGEPVRGRNPPAPPARIRDPASQLQRPARETPYGYAMYSLCARPLTPVPQNAPPSSQDFKQEA